MRLAGSSSLRYSASLKPTVNVSTGRDICSDISATFADVSTPPDRNTPNGTSDIIRESIAKRMMSDVPFGVFLSGGVDSSANVALMSEQMSRPVETFTVGFSDAEYLNELESARRIAKQFGTNHHEVIISEKEMQEFLPSMIFHQDEPIADPVCVPLYYV